MNPNESSSSSRSSSASSSISAAAGNAVRDVKEKAQRTAAEVMSKAKETATEVVGAQKDAAAEGIAGYGSALHDSARSMEAQDPNIAHYAHQAADRLQQVADYVREADYTRMRQDAENVARRHPALFIGGMLVAGLVLGNLAKTSAQALREGGGRANRDDENDPSTGENRGPQDFGYEGDDTAVRQDDPAMEAESAPRPATAFGGGSVSTGPVNF